MVTDYGIILAEEYGQLAFRPKRLHVFDFDDTLAKTDAMIYVQRGDGMKFTLTPGEFALYAPHKDDVFDFRDFSDELINPREIKWVANVLRAVYRMKGPDHAVILTARGEYKPIRKFLKDIGTPEVYVIALNNGSPQAKADYIEQRILEDNLELVEFFDDSIHNVEAVDALQDRYPYVKIIARHMKH